MTHLRVVGAAFMETMIRRAIIGGLAAASLLASASTQAQTSSPYQRGPAPTAAALQADAGPFAIDSVKLTSSQTAGFGNTTVYYPTDTSQGQFGVVVLCPGIGAVSDYYVWLATRVASWGFVVINMNANTIAAFDAERAKSMMAALQSVTSISQSDKSSPLYGRIDTARQAVMGHSMGGGGALDAGLDNPNLWASVGLAPGGVETSTSNLSKTVVPTLIIGFTGDIIVPPALFAGVYYAEYPSTLDSAYLLMNGNHLTPTLLGRNDEQALLAEESISWLKRFVDIDTRYDPFVQNVTGSLVSSYQVQGLDF